MIPVAVNFAGPTNFVNVLFCYYPVLFSILSFDE